MRKNQLKFWTDVIPTYADKELGSNSLQASSIVFRTNINLNETNAFKI